MFESIKNLLSNKKETKPKKPELITSYNPLSFPEDTTFSKKTYSTVYDIKDELLDPQKAKDTVFVQYDFFMKDYDTLMFESTQIRSDLLVIYPKKLGREYSKTCSLYAIDDEENPKEVVYEILSGYGYFLLQSKTDEKDIKIIKLGKNNKIIIPKKYYYLIINSSESEPLVSLSLMSKSTMIRKNNFKNDHGATLYYTDSGFIKNQNKEANYSLSEFEGNFTQEKLLSNDNTIYKDFLKSPEKYEFLKL
jgi:hypothetical protein